MTLTDKYKDAEHADGEAVSASGEDAELQQGIDYYLEDGLMVFTAAFLLKRGYCCDSGCRHCPFVTD